MTKTIFQFAVTLLMVSFFSNANAQKFGHINSPELIQLMPQTKSADSTLKRYGESLDSQLKGMTSEYQNKLQTYQQKMDSMPEDSSCDHGQAESANGRGGAAAESD